MRFMFLCVTDCRFVSLHDNMRLFKMKCVSLILHEVVVVVVVVVVVCVCVCV